MDDYLVHYHPKLRLLSGWVRENGEKDWCGVGKGKG